MSAPHSPFDALPGNVAHHILPYVTSIDWINFRLVSRSCYGIVHGTTDVTLSFCSTCQLRDSDSPSVSSQTCGACSTSTNAGEDTESESLWRLALVRDYQFEKTDEENLLHQSIHSPIVDPQSSAFLSTNNVFTASNSFEAWKHWRKIDARLHHSPRGVPFFGSIPNSEKIVGPYFLRAASLWRKIEQWCDDEDRSGTLGGEIKASLSPGRALNPNQHGRIQNANTSALKAVYSFYAGQCDPMMAPPSAGSHRVNPFTGLFGGFQAYHVMSSTRWMEPDFVINTPPPTPPHLSLAQSDEEKVIIMDLETGQVYFMSANSTRSGGRFCATPCPGGIIRRTANAWTNEEIIDPLDGKDSILRWFEEHAKRLHQNFYSVGNIISHIPGGETLCALMTYPTVADTANCSRAVTRGVEVVASAIHVPEMDAFVYSIRMRLLTPEDGEGDYMTPEQRGFETCQLKSRYWKISSSPPNSDEPLVDEVRGDGVIGMYPLLAEGEFAKYEGSDSRNAELVDHGRGYFSYQSCSQADLPGFIEGYLHFVPGSLAEPNGEVFNVRVAPFPLKFSSFLY